MSVRETTGRMDPEVAERLRNIERQSTARTEAPKVDVEAKAPEPMPKVSTDISNVKVTEVAEGDAPDAVSRQAGLNFQITGEAESYVKTLPPPLQTELAQIGSAYGTGIVNGVNVLDQGGELNNRWSEYMGKVALHGNVDVNALVQHVLRESYQETTNDLRFYADKVRFYNNVKKQIREELTRAREVMSQYAGADPEAQLNPPFAHKQIITDYVGGQNVVENSEEAEAAASALAAASSALTASMSGGGVQLLDNAAKAQLNPAPSPSGAQVIITADGHRIDAKPPEINIYNSGGQRVTRIWGDPHVNEGGGGDDWHFGADSTFILPDGTKLCLDCTQNGNGEWFVTGMDVLSGNQRVHVGNGGNGTSMNNDRASFDANRMDSQGPSSGVFALAANGQWAMRGSDGQFRDVQNETWSQYRNDRDVDVAGGVVTVTSAQALAAQDATGTPLNEYNAARQDAEGLVSETKAQLEAYIKSKEEQLSSVGDDAQLANVDLQNMLQKQQQTLQMMSNISKMLHDTAMAIVRKIGG